MKGEDYILPENKCDDKTCKSFKLIFRSQNEVENKTMKRKRHFKTGKTEKKKKEEEEEEDGEDVDENGYPPLETDKSKYIWLGTGWLRNFYTTFDQD